MPTGLALTRFQSKTLSQKKRTLYFYHAWRASPSPLCACRRLNKYTLSEARAPSTVYRSVVQVGQRLGVCGFDSRIDYYCRRNSRHADDSRGRLVRLRYCSECSIYLRLGGTRVLQEDWSCTRNPSALKALGSSRDRQEGGMAAALVALYFGIFHSTVAQGVANSVRFGSCSSIVALIGNARSTTKWQTVQ